MNFNERLAALKAEKKKFTKSYQKAVIAYEMAVKRKRDPAGNVVWDNELTMLSQASSDAFHSMKSVECERDDLLREAHQAVQEAIRSLGADKIVSTCTFQEATDLF